MGNPQWHEALPSFRGDPRLWGTSFGREGNYGLGKNLYSGELGTV